MGEVDTGQASPRHLRDILLASAVLTLPTILPVIFGWLQIITPILSFYVVLRHGRDQGIIVLIKAVLITAGLALFSDTLQALFVGIILLPLGVSLASSFRSNRSAEMAGFYGLATLIACYCGLWLAITSTTGVNPYQSLQTELGNAVQQWADNALETARAAGNEEEVLRQLKIGLQQAKNFLPLILPGFLLVSIIFQVWFNLIMCGFLHKVILPDQTNLQDFRHWRLPDQLVWLFILCGVALIFPQNTAKVISFNGIIIFGFLYCLQGFAVLTFLLRKWRVPLAIRGIIYILLIVPGYGLLMVSGLGLVEIWLNFRIPRQQEENNL